MNHSVDSVSKLSVVVTVSILLCLFATFWLRQVWLEAEARVQNDAAEVRAAKLSVYREYVRKSIELYDYIAADLANRYLQDGVEEELVRLQELAAHLLVIMILDKDGQINHWSLTDLASKPEVSYRDYYHTLRDNPDLERYISSAKKADVNSDNHPWFFSLSRPIKDESGNFDGVVVIAIDINGLNGELFSHLSSTTDSLLTLRNDGSTLIRTPIPEEGLDHKLPALSNRSNNPIKMCTTVA